MFGNSAIGIWLNSGGAIHRAKLLEDEEYARFCEELPRVPSAKHKGRKMVDGMTGDSQLQRKVAWRHYLGAKLKREGFGSTWQRKYLVLEEFNCYIGSFAEYHFGARFPLRFRDMSGVPDDLWHLRGHMYVARDRAIDPTGRRNYATLKPQDGTVDIFVSSNATTQFLPLIRGKRGQFRSK